MTDWPDLLAPHGAVRAVWHPDPLLYETESLYRARVEQFVRARLGVNASISDAVVAADEAGQRLLVTESWFDIDGRTYQDRSGRLTRQVVMVPLADDVALP